MSTTWHGITCHDLAQKSRASQKSLQTTHLDLARRVCWHIFYNYLVRKKLMLAQNYPSKEGGWLFVPPLPRGGI
jgi:hypothetical protein